MMPFVVNESRFSETVGIRVPTLMWITPLNLLLR